jgi:hypothetical protein
MARTQKLQDFMDSNPCYDIMANDQMILAKAAKDNCTFEEAASRLGSSLLIAPNFKSAYQAFLQRHPEYDGVTANMLVAFHHLPEFELNPTPEMIEEIASRGLLAVSNRHNQQQSDAREIEELKYQISRGQSKFESYNKWNVRTMFESKDLESMSLGDLRALAAKVEGERSLQALPPEQRRAAIKQSTAYQVPAAKEIPEGLLHTCVEESKYFQSGQTVELNALNFLRMSKHDERVILNKWGCGPVQIMMDKFKQANQK